MAKPLASNLRIDARLTAISQAITNEEYIHDKVLPMVQVPKRTGNIGVYANDQLRIHDGRRSNKDVDPHMVEWSIGTDLTYKIQDYDHDFPITDIDFEEYEKPFEAQVDATFFLNTIMQQRMEGSLADQMADATLFTNTSTPGVLWDVSTSDPFADMETAAESIRTKIGRRPNYATINAAVISKLKTHPDFLARINGIQKDLTQSDVVTMIENHLGLRKLLVGSAVHQSTIEGQTGAITDLWSDDMVLYWRPETGSLRVPSVGYRFMLSANKVRRGIFKYRNPFETGDIVRIAYSFEDKFLDPANSAFLLDQVIT